MAEEDVAAEPVVAGLAEVDWLVQVPRDDLLALSRASRLVELDAGEMLYASGDEADRLFVVLSGQVGASRRRHPGGDEDVVWYFISDRTPVTLCVENVITGIPFLATMLVLEDATQVLVVPREALEGLLAQHPGTGIEIARHVARRLQGFTEQVVDAAGLDTTRRVAKYLLRLADPDGLTAAMTQADLAARLAISRQSVNAALARLTARGWVSVVGRGRYQLADPASLGRFVGETGATGAERFR